MCCLSRLSFAKLKINYTVVGKRKLKQLVDEGLVLGWDDPRMSTLAGMRRRGYTAASLRNFCESVGVARSESQVDISMLEHALREDLDNNAPRAMCVLRPAQGNAYQFARGNRVVTAESPEERRNGETERCRSHLRRLS